MRSTATARTNVRAFLHFASACLLAVMIFSAAAAPAAVTAASGVALTTVSGPSPFANCAIGSGPGATLYPNAEVEPYVAVNPANPKNIIGVWQQDRWSDGGARGLVAGYSFNGGKTWAETPQPFSACAPGGLSFERASDPWVSFGPDSVAYSVGLVFNESNYNNGVAASVSKDGGKTWSNPVMLINENQNLYAYSDDKESVTADPVHPGVAYAIWDRYVSPTGNPHGAAHVFAYKAPVYFTRTTDGGQTWSPAQMIVNVNTNQVAIGNQIVIDPRTGALYNFYDLAAEQSNFTYNGLTVMFIKSTDGGSTWSAPQAVADLKTVYVYDPGTGAYIRTSDIIPEAAIDPATGQLYVAWQDSRFNGGQYDEIALSTSTDGGGTWSAPVRVNTPTGHPAFNPQVSVNSGGVVAVTYDDFRYYTSQSTTLPTDYWFTTSSDHGASFGGEVHLSGSFDLHTAPVAGGLFLGDYMGLGASGSGFVPFFTQTNSGNTSNRTDVMAAGVNP